MVCASECVRELLERIAAGVGVDVLAWVSQDVPRRVGPAPSRQPLWSRRALERGDCKR